MNEETQYNVPEMPATATTVHPVKKSALGGHGKVVALGAVGVVAGVAGAAGISAYTRAPGMTEKSVSFPSVEGSGASETASGTSGNHTTAAAAGAGAAAGATAGSGAEGSAHTASAGTSTFDYGTAEAAAPAEIAENIHTHATGIEVPDSLDEVQVAFSPDDSMSFQEAFASARGEVGPHGLFAWRGSLFGTYYEDEWNELPKEYRTEFSNHDWSQHGDLVFITDEVPAPVLPPVQHDEDGRALMALIQAVTGEEVYYYPDGNMTPVLDSNGQVIAFVDKDVLESAAGKSIVMVGDDVIVTDHPENYMESVVTEDYPVIAGDTEMAAEYTDPEDGTVTVIGGEADDVVEAQVDDDAVVIDMNDYDMAEVDDDTNEVMTITEDAIVEMPDIATYDETDDPIADDANDFNDYTI